jgi:hypothetical protein
MMRARATLLAAAAILICMHADALSRALKEPLSSCAWLTDLPRHLLLHLPDLLLPQSPPLKLQEAHASINTLLSFLHNALVHRTMSLSIRLSSR